MSAIHKGIPTIGPRGIQFRSRIEAHWAYLFDELGWDWEYEPIDLNGYIPDFVLKFPPRHVLVEVKGETELRKLCDHSQKIIDSGWDGEFIIVGGCLQKFCDTYSLGLLGGTNRKYCWPGIHWEEEDSPYIPNVDDQAVLIKGCDGGCKSKYSIIHSQEGFGCRSCGYGSGDDWIWRMAIDNKTDCARHIDEIWSKCKNMVQWKSPVASKPYMYNEGKMIDQKNILSGTHFTCVDDVLRCDEISKHDKEILLYVVKILTCHDNKSTLTWNCKFGEKYYQYNIDRNRKMIISDANRIIIDHVKATIIVDSKEKGGHVSFEKYMKFKYSCSGDCQYCMNTRIQYQFIDEDNEYAHCSCVQCYQGDDWGNDMFCFFTK